ncbi:MAG: hypothetical protein FD134_1399, partial [Gallionellaceae bacterium]
MTRTILARATAILLFIASTAVTAAPFPIGPLTLDWPEGFAFKAARPPYFEVSGPQGTEVEAQIFSVPATQMAASEAKYFAKLQKFAEQFMLSSRTFDRPDVPLAKETLPDGSALFYLGRQIFSSEYLL